MAFNLHIPNPEKKRHFFLVFLLGATVAASPALERLFPGFYRSFTYVYFCLLVFIVYKIINKSKLIPLRLPSWINGMIILSGLMGLLSIKSDFLIDALADTTRTFYIPLLFVLFWGLNLHQTERKWGAWGLIAGAFLFLLLLLNNDITNLSSPDQFSKLINRNLMGSVFVSGFAAALFLYQGLDKYKVQFRNALLVIMLLFVFFTLYTYSRSSLLGLMLILVAYLFAYPKKRRALWLTLALTGFGWFVTEKVQDYVGLLKLREEKIESVSSGRSDIWLGVWESLADTYFLGAGTAMVSTLLQQSESYKNSEYGRYAQGRTAAHNYPLKILAENGIVGILLYLYFTYGLIRFAWQCRQINFILLGAALFSTAFVQFHDYTIAPWFVVALMLPTHEIRNYRAQYQLLQKRRLENAHRSEHQKPSELSVC